MTAGLFLAALRHDRAVVLGSLALVVLLAWTYLLLGAGVGMEMMDMGGGQIMLMALLFVGGIMNLAWIAGIALLVLIEKTLPWGRRISQATGAVLIAWGVITLATVV